jgi:hypothetical protein
VPLTVRLHNRFTGLADLLTMATGAVDVVVGATQCASGVGTGLPPPRVGISLKGDAVVAFYNLCKTHCSANYVAKLLANELLASGGARK